MKFTPVTFSKSTNTPVFRQIAAAGGAIGSHSVAIDTVGDLYSWGSPHATGLGSLTPVTTPTKIQLVDPSLKFHDVSCGGGFTIAIVNTTEVYSWGMWSHGRLGLGQPPAPRKQLGKKGKHQPRYQLRPARNKCIIGARAISCGDSHALCLLLSGEVLAWGKNSVGQLGSGVTSAGFLNDSFTPAPISPFCKNSKEFVKATAVTSGTYHSFARDELGRLWSWGGRGSFGIGRGLAYSLQGQWSSKVDTLFSTTSNQNSIMVPCELLKWCSDWASPGLVPPSPTSSELSTIVAGEGFSAFLYSTGEIEICGEGPVVPPHVHRLEIESDVLSDFSDEDFYPVVLPTMPTASWLPSLCSRHCTMIAGSNQKLFVLTEGEVVNNSFTIGLYQKLLTGRLDDKDDEASMIGSTVLSDSVFRSRGLADCILISSGKLYLAHRALLAVRSPVLRDMIMMETTDDDLEQPTQLLLPELNTETAQALLYYLYTDELHASAYLDRALQQSLSVASKMLRIPRLQLLCEYVIAANDTLEALDDEDLSARKQLDVPPLTLTRDLGALVGDPQFADVRFLAEGKSLYAHKFILEYRSDYFEAMFRSGMSERNFDVSSTTGRQVIDVVVPGLFPSFISFGYFMKFLQIHSSIL